MKRYTDYMDSISANDALYRKVSQKAGEAAANPKPKRFPRPALIPAAAALTVCAVIGGIVAYRAPEPDILVALEPTNIVAADSIGDYDLKLDEVYCDRKCIRLVYALKIGGRPVCAKGAIDSYVYNSGEVFTTPPCVALTNYLAYDEGELVIALTFGFEEEAVKSGTVRIRLYDLTNADKDADSYGDAIDGEIAFDAPINYEGVGIVYRAEVGKTANVLNEAWEPAETLIKSVEVTSLAVRIECDKDFDLLESVKVNYANGEVFTRGNSNFITQSRYDGVSTLYLWIRGSKPQSVTIGDLEVVDFEVSSK